jgi:hypothetical protein
MAKVMAMALNTPRLDRDQTIDMVEDLAAMIWVRFPQGGPRLDQLGSHFRTIEMVINHLYDEEERGT